MLSASSDDAYLSGGKYKWLIGVDEAGRGPLAGPVVTAALCVLDGANHIDGIRDSKLVKEQERELIYEKITADKKIVWAVCVVEHTEIDEVNILQATMNGMRRATNELVGKIKAVVKSLPKALALIDGNRCPSDMMIDCQFIIKGDSKVYSIAAASIIAKVTRDRIMMGYHTKYPMYNFQQHKGYPTFNHRTLLQIHGPCEIHRLTFGPVRTVMQNSKTSFPIKSCKATKIKKQVEPIKSTSEVTVPKNGMRQTLKKVIVLRKSARLKS